MIGPELIGTAVIALGLLFALTYWFGRRIDNYSVVDVVWSYAFAALAVFYALAAEGWWVRRLVIAGMVVTW